MSIIAREQTHTLAYSVNGSSARRPFVSYHPTHVSLQFIESALSEREGAREYARWNGNDKRRGCGEMSARVCHYGIFVVAWAFETELLMDYVLGILYNIMKEFYLLDGKIVWSYLFDYPCFRL